MVNYSGWLSNRMNKINFSHPTDEDYANVDRKKTRMELVLISLVVFGIEICYAAETAFVSPIIQKIGVCFYLFHSSFSSFFLSYSL